MNVKVSMNKRESEAVVVPCFGGGCELRGHRQFVLSSSPLDGKRARIMCSLRSNVCMCTNAFPDQLRLMLSDVRGARTLAHRIKNNRRRSIRPKQNSQYGKKFASGDWLFHTNNHTLSNTFHLLSRLKNNRKNNTLDQSLCRRLLSLVRFSSIQWFVLDGDN